MSETAVLEVDLPDEAATAALAQRLAPALRAGGVVYLHGELGAGKTSFARALLRALGANERIKSPTYSLIESYRFGGIVAHHLDLYRIADPGELEFLGLDALAEPSGLVLVEWPERGAGALPPPDWRLDLAHAGTGRRARLSALSAPAREALGNLQLPRTNRA